MQEIEDVDILRLVYAIAVAKERKGSEVVTRYTSFEDKVRRVGDSREEKLDQ